MRSEMAQPCCGSNASVRRIKRSSVPCGSSILFCAISGVPPATSTRDNTPTLVEAQGESLMHLICQMDGSGGEPFPAPASPRPLWGRRLAARALELAQKAGERFDGVEGNRVVERYAHPADGTMAGGAHQARLCGSYGKLLFNGF